MIHCVEVKNYRSIKYLRRELQPFQVLIGPNASGKTTFLDVINFLADIVRLGIDEAIRKRSANFHDLTYIGAGGTIELAIEFVLPEQIQPLLVDKDFRYIRYEIEFGLKESEHVILEESAFLLKEKPLKDEICGSPVSNFPALHEIPEKILNPKYKAGHSRRIFRKNPMGTDNYYDETQERAGKGWMPSFKFGPKKTALGHLPADETKFPASNWLKTTLIEGIQSFILDSQHIRLPSPPGQTRFFKPDGSNLPWIIDDLKINEPRKFQRWLEHLRTALPEIEDIRIIKRPEDRHKYIQVNYLNGGRIPSWLVSDGTLRLLALTIPAYLPNLKGIFLIEEPENGIHPRAIETVYQSLSSIYGAQILLASHSPIILTLVKPQELLCFAKTKEGITDIVNGALHPKLQNWKGIVNLSDLFAGGILG